ncbi:exo-alpha-sialidase [Patescibacteria group bacterium]|nr:MAG: exo-alpha-sialidase [Patescibacteria group bacterium]
MNAYLSRRSNRGFTIIELLIVMIIIAILAAIILIAYNGVTSSARDKSVLSDLDGLDGIETDYGIKNNVAGLAWYSGPSGTNGAPDATLSFTPSSGNIIDVVVNSTDYCIRGYNPNSATYKTLSTAAKKESTSGVCNTIAASAAAIADSPIVNTFTTFTLTAQTSAGSQEWTGGVASSSNGLKLVAGDDCGKVVTSTNSGSTWVTQIAECPTGTANWKGFTSSSDGTKLVGVSGNSGGYIYTSTDSGVTWTQRASTSNGWAYVAGSSDGTKLVAVSRLSPGYVYTSTDSGVTWTQRTSINSIMRVASSSDGTRLVLTTYGGYIYTSTDSGVTWTQQTGSGSRNWGGVASSSDGTKLVAGVYGDYIYTSTDSGVTWTQQTGSGIHGWATIASSTDGTKLFAGDDGYSGHYSSNYIYTSTDSGVTWTQQTSAGSHYWWNIASSSDGSRTLFSPEVGYLYVGVYQ